MADGIEGLDALLDLERAVGEAAASAMEEMAMVGQREALRNAPRSPTTTQSRNTAKKKRAGAKNSGKAKAGAKSAGSKRKASKAGAKEKTASKRKAKVGGLVKRPSRRAKSREAPGGLERSIKSEFRRADNWEESEVELFVAAGSEATKYARKIEEERYKTWKKRGVGTVRKGARAKEFFIKRAAGALPVEQAVADAITEAVEGAQAGW